MHQAFFACWAVATGLHVLAHLGPAVVLVGQRSAVPGGRRRLTAVALILAAIAAALLLGAAGAWAPGRPHTLRPAARVEDTAAGRRPQADPGRGGGVRRPFPNSSYEAGWVGRVGLWALWLGD